MKKILALLLALTMIIGLSACGESAPTEKEEATEEPAEPTQEPTPEPTLEPIEEPITESWSLAYYVDDFGDPTDSAYLQSRTFKGTFSNTATQDAALTVILSYNPYFSDPESYEKTQDGKIGIVRGTATSSIGFCLLEYDENKALYTSGDNVVLKFKRGDETFSANLYGLAPNGDLLLAGNEVGQMKKDEAIGKFILALNKGEEIKCVIEIGSSKYSFTVDGMGFLEQYKELQKTYGITPY